MLFTTKHASEGKHLGYTTAPGNWLSSYLTVTYVLCCASPGTSRRKSSHGGPSQTTPSTANSMEVQFKGHLGCHDVASLSHWKSLRQTHQHPTQPNFPLQILKSQKLSRKQNSNNQMGWGGEERRKTGLDLGQWFQARACILLLPF